MTKVKKVTIDEAKELTMYLLCFPACHSGTSLSQPFWFGLRGWLVQSFVLNRLTWSQQCLQLIVIDRVHGGDGFLLLQEGRKENHGVLQYLRKGPGTVNELTHSYWGNTDVFGNKSISVTWKMFRLKEGDWWLLLDFLKPQVCFPGSFPGFLKNK